MCYTNDDSSSSSSSSPNTASASTSCSALMLWANQLNEPKNERDAGMMPPPTTTLPLNIRRSSLTGMLSCSDQISPPVLKSEIIDENSQSSCLSTGPDTMSHDSMDHFANENSMDGSNSAPSQVNMLAPTPLELIMQKNAVLSNAFQPTMDQSSLMEMASNVVDLRVKQEEQIVAQIQELVNQNSSDNADMLVGVNRPVVDSVPMFVQTASTTANATTADVMFNNTINSMGQNVTATPTDHQMQQALEQTNTFPTHQNLMTEAGTATTMNHILNYPNGVQALSPNVMSTSPTSNSPLSQDVMLNSQPLNASSNMINGGNSTVIAPIAPIATTQSESDIIMNPTISPTMMCHNTGNDANNLLSNAVTMGESAMLAANLPAPQQPTTSDAILTNLMQPMSIKQSPVAVKNMILNAAADILSSEPNSITTETTMNALMSLNSTPMCAPERSSPTLSVTQAASSPPNVSLLSQPTPGMMMPNHHHFEPNPTTQSIANILTNNDSTSSVVVLAGNNQLIQNVVAAAAAQNATEIIQNQIVPAETMLNNFAMPNHIAPQMINVQSTPSAATAGLNQVQQNFLNNLQ